MHLHIFCGGYKKLFAPTTNRREKKVWFWNTNLYFWLDFLLILWYNSYILIKGVYNMYAKDKTEQIKLRVSALDYQFLQDYSQKLGTSLSDVVRKIIADYRVSLTMLENMKTIAYEVNDDGNK